MRKLPAHHPASRDTQSESLVAGCQSPPREPVAETTVSGPPLIEPSGRMDACEEPHLGRSVTFSGGALMTTVKSGDDDGTSLLGKDSRI